MAYYLFFRQVRVVFPWKRRSHGEAQGIFGVCWSW